jgi:hypothetical protein
VASDLRASLPSAARGRHLVIDYFASHRCGAPVGDLTATFRADEPGADYVELDPLDDVRCFAEARLVPLLAEARATLRWAGPTFARHLAVELDRSELWLQFLDRPGIVVGKGLLRRTR